MIEINTKKPTSSVFNLVWISFSEIFEANEKLFPLDTVPKIFRTAVLADILYQEGIKEVIEDNKAEDEIFALLFESFIFYTRIVYDLSTDILQNHTDQTIKKSYSDLIIKIKNNKIDGLDEKLKESLIKHFKKFTELKKMRDAIKRTASASIYLKNKTYYVKLKYFDKTNNYKILDDKLSSVIFEECIFICLLAINLKEFIIRKSN